MSEQRERPFFYDIEELFSEFIEYIGGKVIEKLESNRTDRPNADYLFDNPNVFGELKTFQKDLFSDKDDFAKLEILYSKWLSNGNITMEEFRKYCFQGQALPRKCHQDLINSASKTIERAIYKANKQIGESKITFNKPEANGVIFLINDGNYFFSNEGFLHIIANLIHRKFKESNFDVVIYITINQVTYKEDSDLDHNFWIPMYTKVDENGETIVSDEFHSFINKLGNKFLTDFLTRKTGNAPEKFTEIEDLKEAIEEMKKHKFIPKEIIYKKK